MVGYKTGNMFHWFGTGWQEEAGEELLAKAGNTSICYGRL